MAERECDECGDLTQIRNLGKLHGKQICKKCRKLVIKEHRKETLNQSSEEERKKILNLSKRQTAIYNKRSYEKNKKLKRSEEEPKIKGSNIKRKQDKSQSYFTFQERQLLFGMLIKKGLSAEEVKERLDDIAEEQSRVREIMRSKNKSEEQIKIKQQEMLEELWNL